jgi:hypothetical protein
MDTGQPGFHRINDQTGFCSNKRTDGITYGQEDIWDFADQEDRRDLTSSTGLMGLDRI